MRLPFSERRRLRRIGNAIDRSDPQLTSLFCMFTRLAADDPMPGYESLRARHNAARPIMTWGMSQPGLRRAD
jgi:hypothetical protein